MQNKENNQISNGNINGHIKNTNSYIAVDNIKLNLDSATAWALCNLLKDKQIKARLDCLEKDQMPGLSSLGAALGNLLDHSSKNNCGSAILKKDK